MKKLLKINIKYLSKLKKNLRYLKIKMSKNKQFKGLKKKKIMMLKEV